LITLTALSATSIACSITQLRETPGSDVREVAHRAGSWRCINFGSDLEQMLTLALHLAQPSHFTITPSNFDTPSRGSMIPLIAERDCWTPRMVGRTNHMTTASPDHRWTHMRPVTRALLLIRRRRNGGYLQANPVRHRTGD
jgi:hypothetical protein